MKRAQKNKKKFFLNKRCSDTSNIERKLTKEEYYELE